MNVKPPQSLMHPLPDVAKVSSPSGQTALNWVGMTEIAQPISIAIGGQTFTIPARLALGVSLKANNGRGVHMSRLFTAADQSLSRGTIDLPSLGQLMSDLVAGQEGISDAGQIKLSLSLPLRRKALVSDLAGWREYPVELGASLRAGRVTYFMGIEIVYSSTCPCSAALSRQLMQDGFRRQFPAAKVSRDEVALWLSEEDSMAGTPHAQRSVAQVRLEWSEVNWTLEPEALINRLEDALGTPVQTAVKRIDEQAFARLNAENLMFCEDAARRIAEVISSLKGLSNWYARVEHQESLHAHNAVAEIMLSPDRPLVF